MTIGSDQPIAAAVRRGQQLQRLSLIAASQAMGRYLRGCADFAMARTPQQAWTALHKMQTDLLRLSVDTIAETANLWRK
jgi:hypothetical protein